MGKKKPFIDKKNASTYHLLYRSQRDVGGGEDGETILWPAPTNKKEIDAQVLGAGNSASLEHYKTPLAKAGLLEDNYDYEQHMKPIKGTGDFFGSTGHRENALQDARAKPLDDEVREVERQLDSIALTADCMDDDVAQALFGDFGEGEFEEILDDFVLTAAQEPDDDEDSAQAFDFDAHIQQLMEKARKKQEDTEGVDAKNHDWGRHDHEFFSGAKALHEKNQEEDNQSGHFHFSLDAEADYEDDGETPGVVPALNPDAEKALCEKFEQTLLEYDSDEVGDLDHECGEIRGDRELDGGDRQLEAALDDFLVEKKDEIFIEGTCHLPKYQRAGGSTFHTLDIHQEPEDSKEVLKEAKEFLATPELDLPPEEILIDGKSYFSQASRNPWDCESILTTYSNLDNNPVTIGGSRRRGKKKKKKTVAPVSEEGNDTEPVKIQLSNKTGLPLGVLPTRQRGDDVDWDTLASVNKGEARSKNESLEEKKLRKLQVKQERQVTRMQKKMMKEAFANEFMKRSSDATADDVTGKSVFRF